MKKQAEEMAVEKVQEMVQQKLVPDDDLATQKAMASLVALLELPVSTGDRIRASKAILDFTKAKPASQSNVTVNAAEEFLKAIAEAEKKGS